MMTHPPIPDVNAPRVAPHPYPPHAVQPDPESPATDFMILPDGTIYARNLTPDLAAILAVLNPYDATMALRAATILRLPP